MYLPTYTYFTNKKIYPNGDIHYSHKKEIQKKGSPQTPPEKNIVLNIERSQRRIKSTIKDYVLCNDFTWFVTLTDKDQLHDRDVFSKRIRKWAENIKQRHYQHLDYIIIIEQHKSGAWHAHALFNDVVSEHMVFAKKRYSKKTKKRHDSYNFSKWNFGFSTAEKIEDKEKVASYIMKYITKDLFVEKNKQAYYCSQGLLLPIKEQGEYHLEITDKTKYYDNYIFRSYKQEKTITRNITT